MAPEMIHGVYQARCFFRILWADDAQLAWISIVSE